MIAKRAKSTYFDELLIGLSPQVKENFGLCVLGATKITFHTSTGEPESRRGGSHCPPVACCAASILHRFGARRPLFEDFPVSEHTEFEW